MRRSPRRFLWRRVSLMRSSTEDASLRREIASYLQLLEEEYQRRGLSVAEAPRQARLSLGGVERTRELHRQAPPFAWIDDMRRDLYDAARILAGNVEFRLAVVLTIGLGIGGRTPVVGVINARLFSGPAHARTHNLSR
jgi:hypothetical protein